MKENILNIQIDLETLSTNPNAAILSIGCVAYTDEGGRAGEFYKNIDRESSIEAGGDVTQSTVDWWSHPDRKEALNSLNDNQISLSEAIPLLSKWIDLVSGGFDKVNLIANGTQGDINWIINACASVGHENIIEKDKIVVRCHRTMYRIFKQYIFFGRDKNRLGLHNALEDAKNQMNEHLMIIKWRKENPSWTYKHSKLPFYRVEFIESDDLIVLSGTNMKQYSFESQKTSTSYLNSINDFLSKKDMPIMFDAVDGDFNAFKKILSKNGIMPKWKHWNELDYNTYLEELINQK